MKNVNKRTYELEDGTTLTLSEALDYLERQSLSAFLIEPDTLSRESAAVTVTGMERHDDYLRLSLNITPDYSYDALIEAWEGDGSAWNEEPTPDYVLQFLQEAHRNVMDGAYQGFDADYPELFDAHRLIDTNVITVTEPSEDDAASFIEAWRASREENDA